MRILWERWKALFTRARLDRELDAELEFHIEEQADEYTRKGMTREKALRAARRDFGGVQQIKEVYRDRRGLPFLESIVQDLRFGLRLLIRDRGFAAATLATLALAIGAATAVFSVVNAVIFRQLPYPEPERLMAILSASRENGHAFYSAPGVYLDWRNRATSFESIEGAVHTSAILGGVAQPRVISVVQASAGFLPLFGVHPLRGRPFGEGEALINEVFWRTELGGKADVLGSRLIVGDRIMTVAGVVPDFRFQVYGSNDVWIPFEGKAESRGGGSVMCVGRLRTGVSREGGQAEMEAIMRQLGTEHQEDSRTGVVVQPLREWIVAESRRPFLLLFAAVILVLLTGCANAANLLIARASAREREMSIRASLGAGRLRLARQAMLESLLLAALGGCAGAVLATVLVRATSAIQSIYIPRAGEIAVDRTMLLIAACLSIAAGLLTGLAPAWGRLGTRVRNALVVGELALALVLLTAAGLVTNSLARLLAIDIGFDRSGLVTVQTRLPYKRYDSAKSAEFHRRLAAEIQRMPGVARATLSDHTPLQAVQYPFKLQSGAATAETMARHVAPGYFATTGIPLLAGRDFESADDTRMPIPVLINTATARALFGGADALGKQIRTNYRSRSSMQVVGVAGDSHQHGLSREPGLQLYLPIGYGSIGYVIARVAPNAGDLGPAIRAASAAIDSEVPAPEIGSLDAAYSRQIALPRFHAILFGSFAALGLALAVIGVYGVMAYAVARRTREFGIRLAVGARPRDLLALILGSGAKLTFAGIAIGLVGALAATRLMRALLYGVEPGDPLTLAAVAAILACAALAACWAAARRASRIDPNTALRCD